MVKALESKNEIFSSTLEAFVELSDDFSDCFSAMEALGIEPAYSGSWTKRANHSPAGAGPISEPTHDLLKQTGSKMMKKAAWLNGESTRV